MPYHSYTRKIAEVMTPTKTDVFIARFGRDVEAAALATAQVQQECTTAAEIDWCIYTVA